MDDADELVARLSRLLEGAANVAEDLADAIAERDDFAAEQRDEARTLASQVRHAEALLEGWRLARGLPRDDR